VPLVPKRADQSRTAPKARRLTVTGFQGERKAASPSSQSGVSSGQILLILAVPRDKYPTGPLTLPTSTRSDPYPSSLHPSSLQRTMRCLPAALTALLTLLPSTHAIYFYLDGTTPKCFYEELPKDTLVVGMPHLPHPHLHR
jgi:hypothetical protein